MTDDLSFHVISHNLKIFNQLANNQKLIINKDGKVEVDTRYFQGLRRALDWWLWSYDSSKRATMAIIKVTFESLKQYRDYCASHKDYIIHALNNLENNATTTYPQYTDMKDLIQQLKEFFDPEPLSASMLNSLPACYQLWHSYGSILKQKKKPEYDVYY